MDRARESVDIMKKLRDELHVPAEDPGLKELGRHLTMFIKYGTVWAGYIELATIKRHLHVILPNNPHMPIRAVLKAVANE